MLILDERPYRIFLFLPQREHLLDRRVALAPRYVWSLIPLPILHVKVGDLVVVVANELDRIEVRRGEMSNVQIDPEILRHGERLREAFRGGEFVRILNVR